MSHLRSPDEPPSPTRLQASQGMRAALNLDATQAHAVDHVDVAWRPMIENQHSTRLSQDAEVRVKCTLPRSRVSRALLLRQRPR